MIVTKAGEKGRRIRPNGGRLRWSSILLIVALALCTAPARADGPDERFGAVEAFWVPEQAAEMGLGWERILFYWEEIQPEGPDDWNTLHVDDRWLADAEARGRQVVGLLKQTPAWATDGIPDAGVPRGLYLPVDDPENLWANYVRRVATYYAPRGVHHWIVWNEPDIDAETYGHEFAGSVADYYQLVKVAAQVMKAVDPDAVIHLAGTTYWHDELAGRTPYLQRLLDVASADTEAATNGFFFDAVSLHIYFRVETVPRIVSETRAILDAYGLEKPIWITETNAPPDQDPAWPVERPAFPVDLEQQAWFLPQAAALGFGAGVARVGVYKLTDVLEQPGAEPFGLLRADLSPRPAFDAYSHLIARLSHFNDVTLTTMDDAYLATFTDDERITRLVWARTDHPVIVTLNAAAPEAIVYDVFGASEAHRARDGRYRIPLQPARCGPECIIGGPPVYVVETVDRVDAALVEQAAQARTSPAAVPGWVLLMAGLALVALSLGSFVMVRRNRARGQDSHSAEITIQ